MYTAEEAREKARQSISDETKQQLIMAEKRIGRAVESGYMRCWYGGNLCKQAIGGLEGLGYKVIDRSNQRDGEQYEISWEEG